MVVGEDIMVSQIMEYLGKTLMGHFFGQRIPTDHLNDWVKKMWSLIIGYGPSFNLLTKGWTSFTF